MEKKDLSDLKREELVDLVYDLMNDEQKEQETEPAVDAEQVRLEKEKISGVCCETRLRCLLSLRR